MGDMVESPVMDPALRGLIKEAESIPQPPNPTPWPAPGQSRAEWLDSVADLRAAHEKVAAERMARVAGIAGMTASITEPVGIDHVVPVDGGTIVVRVFTPPGEGPFPGVVTLHGGGWWAGGGEFGMAQADGPSRMLAQHVGAVVANVDYRLAPEHQFPVPLEDSYAAFEWVAANTELLNIRGDRIALMGASAGANLVAAATLMARDRGGPQACLQVLLAPAVNPAMDTDSVRDSPTGMGFAPADLAHAWDMYLGADADRSSPLAAPLLAADFSGLPPAHVITAEFDPLKDEGLAYACKLEAAGVPVVHNRYPMTHGIALPETAAAYLTDMALAMRAALHNA